jgi:hypothetical protein
LGFQALEGTVLNKPVRLEIMGNDRYKRIVSIVWFDGRNINRKMVTEGCPGPKGNISTGRTLLIHPGRRTGK